LRKIKFYKGICYAVLLYIYRQLTEPGELPVLTANWPSLQQNESE
jgi:hypothetical protein